MTDDANSLTFNAYQRLRREVLSGALAPGRKLKIQELSAAMKVSPGVIREALSRLSSESLVVAEPQRGFHVAPISAEDVCDLTRVRTEIELMCLKQAMENGEVRWEAVIVAALHELTRTPFDKRSLNDAWTVAHARFHEALVAACSSKWLLRIREQLFVQGERYRWINVRLSDDKRDLRLEHANLAEAVIGRDVERATRLMAAHLKATETLTLGSLGQGSERKAEGNRSTETESPPVAKTGTRKGRSTSGGLTRGRAPSTRSRSIGGA